jgi:tetratricopeptide (TPR) repeat protein
MDAATTAHSRHRPPWSWIALASGAAALALFAAFSWRTSLAEGHCDRGWAALAKGDLARAAAQFQRADALDPGSGAARGLGESWLMLHRRLPVAEDLLDRAEGAFRRAVAASAADIPSLLRLEHVRVLRDLRRGQDPGPALVRAADLAARHPGLLRAQRILVVMAGDVLEGRGGEGSLPADPDFLSRLEDAGTAVIARGHLTYEEFKALVTSPQVAPASLLRMAAGDDGFRRNLARDLVAGGRWDARKRDILREARDLQGGIYGRLLAEALRAAGRRHEALGLLQEQVGLHPADSQAFLLAATWTAEAGDDAAAREYFRQAVATEGRQSEARLAYAAYLQGKGDLVGAEGELREILALWPEHPEARRRLSLLR